MARVAIVVAGMHRSGTSALARLLIAHGCDAPKTLLPANEYNAKGYWESQEITDFNDEILTSAGLSWHSWDQFGVHWYASPVADRFRDRAQTILASEFGHSALFVLKDPRICRLMPFWLKALEDFGAIPHVVLPLRNPLEVAASLAQRDAIDPPFGLLMWLRNVLDAEAETRHCPRTFLRYERLLVDWMEAAAKMERDLGVVWPRRSNAVAFEVEADLSPGLRHHIEHDSHFIGTRSSRWVADAYDILERWAHGEVLDTDTRDLDTINDMLSQSTQVLAHPLAASFRVGPENRRLKADMVALESTVAETNKVVADHEDHIASLNEAVRERDETIAKKDSQIANLDQAIADRDKRIDMQLHAVTDRDERIAALCDAVGERDDKLSRLLQAAADLKHAVVDRDTQIDALHRSTSWRITAPLRFVRAVTAKSAREPVKLFALAVFAVARVLWRLLPLGKNRRLRWRQPLLRALPRSLAMRLASAATHDTVRYVPSGRVDLPELGREAAHNQGPVPILFDPDYYLANNADVKTGGIEPLTHYLEHGAIEGRLPIDIDMKEIDPVVLSLHRLDLTQAESVTFDAELYRAIHADLTSLDDEALAEHYQSHGKADGRVASKAEFLRDLCGNPREIPIDFRAAQYIELYPDLRPYADEPPLEALRHYMRFGRWEPRLYTLRGDCEHVMREPAVDLNLSVSQAKAKPLCVLAHVYYPELWEELRGYIANLPSESFDLYVNLVDTTFDQHVLSKVRADFPLAHVYISENTGRDIGGHFRVLRNVRMEDYDIFCLVHTKMSPHMSKGEVQLWRRRLLEPLMGSRDLAANNIRLMLDDEKIGLLGSARCRYTELNDNSGKYFALLKQLGISESEDDVEFLSGTMMFLRRAVLQRLHEVTENIRLEGGDSRSTDFHRDGQWAHAVERAFGAVVRDMNYRFEWR